jgi:hypothetical protein
MSEQAMWPTSLFPRFFLAGRFLCHSIHSYVAVCCARFSVLQIATRRALLGVCVTCYQAARRGTR